LLSISSCVTTSNLQNNIPIRIVGVDAGFDFLETKTLSGVNLTLSEILLKEKKEWGNDISIVNVVEQKKTTNFLFIFTTTERYYLYDVIRNNENANRVSNLQNEPTLNLNLKNNVKSDSLMSMSKIKLGSLVISMNDKSIEVYPTDLMENYSWEEAKIQCDKLGLGWRLPSLEELKKIHEELFLKGVITFQEGKYWSINEFEGIYSWCWNFNKPKNNDNFIDKDMKLLVRPVRIKI